MRIQQIKSQTLLLQAILIVGMLLLKVNTSAQSIDGVINRYTEVTFADFCNNVAVVTSASGFSVGDRVLIYQTQGAEIVTDDNLDYGSVSQFNGAGKFEILTISDVVSNIIHFEEAMLNEYNPAGKIQLIDIPLYNNPTVTAPLSCDPWDGTLGGVLIFEATGTVTLNADIDVSGRGFRGGGSFNHVDCFAGGNGYDGFRCVETDECGGRKGEGIAGLPDMPLGRGINANGGGGGNDHNTGGGGGGNYGQGGIGGQNVNPPAGECLGTNPGLGGITLPYIGQGRVYLGGGGGAGDWNDNDGSVGGNGGGIVIILANEIDGNGNEIRANGIQAGLAGTDGAGGGGGAGSVFLDVNTYSSALRVEVEGGDGGDVDNGFDPDVCFGPGGGGSGGLLWISGAALDPNITADVAGGFPGQTTNPNAPTDCTGSNGASTGSDGEVLENLLLPQSTLVYEELDAALFNDTTICVNDSVFIGPPVTVTTGESSFLWSNGSTDSAVLILGTQPGLYTLEVFDARGCSVVRTITISSTEAVAVEADPNGLISPGQSVTLNATEGLVSYLWLPDSALSDNSIFNPIATPGETIEYCVIATDSLGCVTDTCITIDVDVAIVIPNAFTPNDDGLNDVFRAPQFGPCDELVTFKIFNRWGTQIFDYEVNGIGWDGTYQGVEQPMGSYIYLMELDCRGLRKSLKGNVTLVR